MIESVIKSRLSENLFVIENLSQYDGEPALFFLDAANDMDGSWDNKKELFPRADYYIDWTADPERDVSGSLIVEVWCRNDGTIPPEGFIEPVKGCLSNVFFKDDTGLYCVVWNKNYFNEVSGGEPAISGVTMTFDVMAFPVHRFNSPDPVLGVQTFIKNQFDSFLVVGYDNLDEVVIPTDEHPVVYVRVLDEVPARPATYAVRWLKATIGIHLFCSSNVAGSQMVEEISRVLANIGWCALDDQSPLRFLDETIRIGADPLKDGQIVLRCEYGILCEGGQSSMIENIEYV